MSDQMQDKLKEIATTDWKTFMQYMDKDIMVTVMARVMRSEGKSWLQIASKLEISPMQARTACKKMAVKK